MWGPTVLFNYLMKKEWLLTGIWKERKIGYKCGVISCPRVEYYAGKGIKLFNSGNKFMSHLGLEM